MTNAPFLESSEHLNRFFPESLHKIMFHKFQNISKCLIHGLRPFKHKIVCESCDIIPDKDNKGIIMLKNVFVLRGEVVDCFHENDYILTKEKFLFHLAHVRILGSIECGKTINDCFRDNAFKIFKVKRDYAEKFSEETGT